MKCTAIKWHVLWEHKPHVLLEILGNKTQILVILLNQQSRSKLKVKYH